MANFNKYGQEGKKAQEVIKDSIQMMRMTLSIKVLERHNTEHLAIATMN
ncbi:MAG TPA: hypothetical protein VGO47_07950 [Chlamydiales bacterium]|jgi:hypothetical protein|nr:hypothetical protein [Chlamydiales bacterium]